MIKYIHPVPARAATGLVATVYEEVHREFGAVVEPFTLHSPVPWLLAGVWRACRATLVTGRVARDVKEAIATAVSRANGCSYCVEAHIVMLDGAAAHDAAQALAAGDDDAIDDPRLRAAVAWGASTSAADAPAAPPFPESELPEVVGTALMFHYINRPVTVLLDTSPVASVPGVWKGVARRAGGWWFGRAIARAKVGEPSPLLPAAPLPDDLRWAADSPAVAEALARFAAVVEEEGARVLSQDVRAVVAARLDTWRGEDVGLGRYWITPLVAPLPEAHRPFAQLALLVALAPHQVDAEIVDAFRAHAPDDAALVAALAWASFAAARRIARRLVPNR